MRAMKCSPPGMALPDWNWLARSARKSSSAISDFPGERAATTSLPRCAATTNCGMFIWSPSPATDKTTTAAAPKQPASTTT